MYRSLQRPEIQLPFSIPRTVTFTVLLGVTASFATLFPVYAMDWFLLSHPAVKATFGTGFYARAAVVAPVVEPFFSKLLPVLVVLHYRRYSLLITTGYFQGFAVGANIIPEPKSNWELLSVLGGLTALAIARIAPKADTEQVAQSPYTVFNIAACGGLAVGLTELVIHLGAYPTTWRLLPPVGFHTFSGALIMSAVLANPQSWYRKRRFWLSYLTATGVHFAWNAALVLT